MWSSPATCAACVAEHAKALLGLDGCTPSDLASFCVGGACKVALRQWCSPFKSANITTTQCLGCARNYQGVLSAAGCNGTFRLFNRSLPSPILAEACAARPCIAAIGRCPSSSVEFHGKFEVDRDERDHCVACTATRSSELAAAGCGRTDEELYCHTNLPTAPDVVTCVGALRDDCGTDSTWSNPDRCASCVASTKSSLRAAGCTDEQLAGYCNGGACKVSIRKWCDQIAMPNASTEHCLGCAGPAAYEGVIEQGGCNGTLRLWNDTASKVPGPILAQACALRPCARKLDRHCVSPTVYWNGAAGRTEVEPVERDRCNACVSTNRLELSDYGCGGEDLAVYCKGATGCKPGTDHCLAPHRPTLKCPGALRDACGSDAVWSSTAGCAVCIAAHRAALGIAGCSEAVSLAMG